MGHEITSPKVQPEFSQTITGQYWIGKTKPKKFDQKCFQQVAMELLKIYAD